MVGAENGCMDFGILYPIHQAVAHHEIVNAPADILLTGLETV